MQAEWPLTGRTGTLQILSRLVRDRSARGAVLAGPAGVGKTRLAMECRRHADQAGLATLWVTATRSASALPFGALAPLLPAVTGWDAGAADARADLLRRATAALVEAAADRRLLLVVDDAQLLDDASATLVHHLGVTGAAFMLLTVRTGEPAPDPVVALWKDGVAQRLDLTGLDSEAIDQLLSAALGKPVDSGTVAHLALRCEGNVLFLRELVLGALGDGTLREEDGIWRLVGPLSPSDRLVELVEARLAGLEPSQRALLETVSFGEPLGRAELEALEEPGLAERLERMGLLVSRILGRRLEVRLAHPIYGDVIRSRVPAVRSADIARFLADVLERTGIQRREDPLRVGTWRLAGGGGRPDVLLAAATTARWSYDFPLAERLAAAAIQAGAGFDAALLAAQLACLSGRNQEAEDLLAALAGRAADDRQRGLVALARLDNGAFFMGRMEDFLVLAREAEAAITDPAWRDQITARRSAILLATEGPSAAREVAEPLLGRAEGSVVVHAALTAAYSLARLGRVEAALAASDQGYRTQLALAEPMLWYPWFQLFARCETLAHAGRFHEAEALATEQYQRAIAEESAEAQAHFAWQLAKTVGDRGHILTAVRLAREAVGHFRALGRPTFVQNALIALATALALGREADEAGRALALFDELEPEPARWSAVDLLEARAWTAAATDDLPKARAWLEEAAGLGEEIGDLVRAAGALHSLARLGRAREVADRLSALASGLEGDLPAARAAHARALGERDPEGLEKVADRFEAMGAQLLAAEAMADAAVHWRSAGNPRRATGANQRATALAAHCEGAMTPALHAIEVRAELTVAERETALLAAAGRSSKEIAAELCLSVRTVENRLQRTYEKLGVSSRAELSQRLHP